MQTENIDKLKIAVLQLDINWENTAHNLNTIRKIVGDNKPDYDILVLPEMFATGFSMSVEGNAQNMQGEIVTWMYELSSYYNIAVMGTVAIKEDGKYFNRAIFINDNELKYYDKRHLFTMGGEDKHYAAGDKRVVFSYKGINILPVICYDIRFPVWLRNRKDYDVMVCMANWPTVRINAWDSLLQARAIENQSFVVGVNRIGMGNGIKYGGHTTFIDSKGILLLQMKGDDEKLTLVEIDIEAQNKFRQKFSILDDTDDFTINM